MIYIIDANNLAGQLELLEDDNFDKILISRVEEYFNAKEIKVILVFDSAMFMGDRREEGNLEIIYTPRDSFYKCADDKVLEIVVNYLDEENFKEEVVVVTDDIELKEKVWEAIKESKNGYRVEILRATDFVMKMLIKDEEVDDDDKKGFSDREVSSLNKELLNKWKNG